MKTGLKIRFGAVQNTISLGDESYDLGNPIVVRGTRGKLDAHENPQKHEQSYEPKRSPKEQRQHEKSVRRAVVDYLSSVGFFSKADAVGSAPVVGE